MNNTVHEILLVYFLIHEQNFKQFCSNFFVNSSKTKTPIKKNKDINCLL